LLAARSQRHLRSELSALERQTLAAVPGQVEAIADQRRRLRASLRYFAQSENARTAPGHALARIRIGRLHVNYVVVQGTGDANLRKGPAHYSQTPLPGASGTMGITGHRTTYLAPFRHLDDLRGGDRVTIEVPYGRFTYAVQRRTIVPAGYQDAFASAGYDRLVLTACHPLYSAAQRILVYARLIDIRPSAASLRRARVQIASLGPASGRPASAGRPGAPRPRPRAPVRPALAAPGPALAGPGPWGALRPLLVLGASALGVLAFALLGVWGYVGIRRHARGAQGAAPSDGQPGAPRDLGGW
jgi:sortase A